MNSNKHFCDFFPKISLHSKPRVRIGPALSAPGDTAGEQATTPSATEDGQVGIVTTLGFGFRAPAQVLNWILNQSLQNMLSNFMLYIINLCVYIHIYLFIYLGLFICYYILCMLSLTE